jgi:hypothetical protein
VQNYELEGLRSRKADQAGLSNPGKNNRIAIEGASFSISFAEEMYNAASEILQSS